MTMMVCLSHTRARSLYMPTAGLLAVALLGPGCIVINDGWEPVMGDSDADTTGRPTMTTTATGSTTAAGMTTAVDTGSADDDDDDDESDTETSEETFTESTGDVSTGGGGAVCGNGMVEGPEDCDDGNVEEGDGCSDACHDEPVGVVLNELEPTALEGVDIGEKKELICGVEGGNGVMPGLDAYGVSPHITYLRGACVVINIDLILDKLELVLAAPFPSDVYGGYGGNELMEDAVCPPGELIVGFRGLWDGDGMRGIELACAEPKIYEGPDGFAIEIPPHTWQEVLVGFEGGGEPFDPILCPDNTVAAGAKLYDNGEPLIYGFELFCHELELIYDDP